MELIIIIFIFLALLNAYRRSSFHKTSFLSELVDALPSIALLFIAAILLE